MLTRATIAAALHVDAATVVVERPKVLYNPATRGFVLWFHLDNTKYTLRRAGVATASSPRGPWTFRGSVLPDGLPSLDLSLFADSDGSAYLVRSVNNTYTGISRLNAEFTDTAPGGMLSTLDVSWAPGRGESFVSVGRAALAAAGVPSATGPSRGRAAVEGMALFRLTNGSYYMVASHMRGWDPNPLMLFRADGPSLEDPRWVHLGNPTHDELAHHSQPAYVVEVRGSSGAQAFMYMGDNWLHAGRRALRDAGYVWLPFRLAPRMMWLWKLRQWEPRQYGLAPTGTALPRRPGGGCARREATCRRGGARRAPSVAPPAAAMAAAAVWSGRHGARPRAAARCGRRRVASSGRLRWASSPRGERRDCSRRGRARPSSRRRRRRAAARAYTRQQRGLPFGAGRPGAARTTVRFVVDEAFAASQRGEESRPLRRAVRISACRDGATAMAYKSLWWWRLAPSAIRARYYVKTDDDALVHLPTLARVARAFDAEGSGLHFAGDVNWGTFDLTRLHGHCWSMLPLGSLQFKPSQCAGEHGPVPFATGSLEVMSSAVVLNLTLTLDRLGWLAQRDDLNSYYEDRLVGLAVAHDARPIRLTYLNTHDHFDKPSGMPFVRAASGQPALLYEHEGP